MLQIRGLSKSYGRLEVLRGIDLDAFRDMRRIRTRLGVAPQDLGI